jgi:hypothetical protein
MRRIYRSLDHARQRCQILGTTDQDASRCAEDQGLA